MAGSDLVFLILVNIVAILILFVSCIYIYAYFAHAEDSTFA